MDTVRTVLLAVLAVSLGGCLGVSPEEARRRAIGDNDDIEDEELHNPGTPCLACHDRDFSPGDDVFAVAGTIYLQASDPDSMGLDDVHVWVRDYRGREFEAITNAAGNFMFEVDEGDDYEVDRRGRGKTKLGFWPEFPLETWIEYGDVIEVMETPILRDGSCATCHGGEPSASSAGRVFVLEEP